MCNSVIVSINNGVLSSVVINDPNIIVEVREYDDYSNHTDINVDEYGNEYGYEIISSNEEEEQWVILLLTSIGQDSF